MIARFAVAALVVGCGHADFDRVRDAGPDDGLSDDANDASVLDPGLLVYLAFEQDGLLLDRASGVDAYCATCPSMGVSRAGAGAAYFDGTSCLHLPATGIEPAQFTFAAAFLHTTPQVATLFGRTLYDPDSLDNTFELYVEAGLQKAHVNNLAISWPLTEGAWHHLAGVFDGVDLYMYVDGALAATQAIGAPAIYAGVDYLTIGCDIDFGNEEYLYIGSLDEVRLYNRALTALEVASLATK